MLRQGRTSLAEPATLRLGHRVVTQRVLAHESRLFELLLKFTQEDAPGFQLIVTEHANLREQWFQDALVELPWTKPPALVPEDWS